MKGMPALPSLRVGSGQGRRARRVVVERACACGGCGSTTKSVWASGHDGYCTGWAIRVERGLVALSEVPDAVVQGVVAVLGQREERVRLAEEAIANVPSTAVESVEGDGGLVEQVA